VVPTAPRSPIWRRRVVCDFRLGQRALGGTP
jgi:hypothetical protein